MESIELVAVSLGGALLLAVVLWAGSARAKRRTHRRLSRVETELGEARRAVSVLQLGEREAAWAAEANAGRLKRALGDLEKATHDLSRLEHDLTETQSHIHALETELEQTTTRAAAIEADLTTVTGERDRLAGEAARVKQLEAEVGALAGLRASLEKAQTEATDLRRRIEILTTERDRLAQQAAKAAQLETEVAMLIGLRSDLDKAQTEAADLRRRLAALTGDQERQTATAASPAEAEARLAAAEAANRELEERLGAIMEARAREQAATRQLTDEIERLRASPDVGAPEPVYREWEERLRTRVEVAVAEETARLRRDVEHLQHVVAEKEQRIRHLLAAGPAPAKRTPPKITDIKGIGPVIASILAEHGITSLEQIAGLDDDEIDRLGEVMPVYPDRIRHDDWTGQAQRLLG